MQAQNQRWMDNPVAFQQKILQSIVQNAKNTAFGQDHHFDQIRDYADFKRLVPVRDYEALRPYIDRIVAQGESNVLWPGLPAYFAKTSGTTSGTKYIPLTRDSVPNHINSARNALLAYIYATRKSDFLDRNLIFLSGSPVLTQTGPANILTGRLSGMVNHHVPAYLRTNQKPSFETNCIEDWEEKLEKIIDETLSADMSLISGIPPWVQMYFDRIQARTGKTIKEVFPNFSLFVYGGVNFEPYRKKLFDSIGQAVDSIETYPASEGFIAYQDSQVEPGLLLLANSGIFFEFIPAEDYFKENPPRYHIGEVELNKNYALVLSSNAGLWSYSIGDTVKFISNRPYRLLVTGRIKHFISAFGEHVIGEEVEKAMQKTLAQYPAVSISEFTVAPQVNPSEGLPHHEWLIAFERLPQNLPAFAQTLDQHLCQLNTYYDDLITGKILRPLRITVLRPDAFQQYMKSIGKLGGQNKVPRLANDRSLADAMREEWKQNTA
ncbi:MAG: GH3 auxin-responsive promoter family protein [Microscillaceae bacterium]